MKKKNFIKKIKEKINKFFEEEEDEEEINLKTLIIIFLIGFVIIISIYVYTNGGFKFIDFNSDKRENMEENKESIEQEEEKISEIDYHFKDYFADKKGLENSDFSEGTNHWSTVGPISNIALNKQYYHSAPQSLQISCLESSCINYYNTKSNSKNVEHPYELDSGIWMGVKPKTKLKISYWYNGCEHHISFLTLNKYGDFDELNGITSKYSEIWIKKEVIIAIPDEVIASGMSIMMGEGGSLLLDDIQLERIE